MTAQALTTLLPQTKHKSQSATDGAVLRASEMQVGDDGHGNALLTFPDGESLVVVGIAPADLTLKDALSAIAVALPSHDIMPTSHDGTVDLNLARATRKRLNHF